jgi:hypothetical protein
MGELLAEPGQLVDLDQQRRQLHPGQPRRRGVGERIRLGRELFGGQTPAPPAAPAKTGRGTSATTVVSMSSTLAG